MSLIRMGPNQASLPWFQSFWKILSLIRMGPNQESLPFFQSFSSCKIMTLIRMRPNQTSMPWFQSFWYAEGVGVDHNTSCFSSAWGRTNRLCHGAASTLLCFFSLLVSLLKPLKPLIPLKPLFVIPPSHRSHCSNRSNPPRTTG